MLRQISGGNSLNDPKSVSAQRNISHKNKSKMNSAWLYIFNLWLQHAFLFSKLTFWLIQHRSNIQEALQWFSNTETFHRTPAELQFTAAQSARELLNYCQDKVCFVRLRWPSTSNFMCGCLCRVFSETLPSWERDGRRDDHSRERDIWVNLQQIMDPALPPCNGHGRLVSFYKFSVFFLDFSGVFCLPSCFLVLLTSLSFPPHLRCTSFISPSPLPRVFPFILLTCDSPPHSTCTSSPR